MRVLDDPKHIAERIFHCGHFDSAANPPVMLARQRPSDSHGTPKLFPKIWPLWQDFPPGFSPELQSTEREDRKERHILEEGAQMSRRRTNWRPELFTTCIFAVTYVPANCYRAGARIIHRAPRYLLLVVNNSARWRARNKSQLPVPHVLGQTARWSTKAISSPSSPHAR